MYYNYRNYFSSFSIGIYLNMPQELILTAGAIISSLAVIFGTIFSVYKIAKKIDDAVGVDSKGRTLSDRLDRVEHQLWENGGSSLADRVNVIGEHVTKTSAKLEVIEKILTGSVTLVQPNDSKMTSNSIKKTRVKKAS
jgi:hypothetical protein